MTVSHVTTHILDTGAGRPAAGVAVVLSCEGRRHLAGAGRAPPPTRTAGPRTWARSSWPRATTGSNFATGSYYAGLETATFFPEVDLVFEVTGPEHYHVPLLLSPFAYSTYRGS